MFAFFPICNPLYFTIFSQTKHQGGKACRSGANSTLYNSTESNAEMAEQLTRVIDLFQADSIAEVKNVNGAKFKEAAGFLHQVKEISSVQCVDPCY